MFYVFSPIQMQRLLKLNGSYILTCCINIHTNSKKEINVSNKFYCTLETQIYLRLGHEKICLLIATTE